MIPVGELLHFGARLKKFSKGERIFNEGQKALYYYQINSGKVKNEQF